MCLNAVCCYLLKQRKGGARQPNVINRTAHKETPAVFLRIEYTGIKMGLSYHRVSVQIARNFTRQWSGNEIGS
jgi:hypothetical protein